MDLHYLTFMQRKCKNRKKLMSIQIMNSANVNSKKVANSVGIWNDIDVFNNNVHDIILNDNVSCQCSWDEL